MLQNVIVAVIVLGLPIGMFMLRTQAALVVLTFFAGAKLSEAVHDDALIFAGGFMKLSTTIEDAVSVALILLPALVIAGLYRKAAGSKLFLQFPPMMLSGLVALYLGLDAVSKGTREPIESAQLYAYISSSEDFVMAVAVFITLIVAILTIKKPKADDHHGKKHK